MQYIELYLWCVVARVHDNLIKSNLLLLTRVIYIIINVKYSIVYNLNIRSDNIIISINIENSD